MNTKVSSIISVCAVLNANTDIMLENANARKIYAVSNGTMNSRLFEFWFSNQLLPSLEQGTVIVMDNASFHSKKRLLFAAQNAGCRLLFLPPYSPELNPIEHFWAWLKRSLRRILPAVSSFDDALSTAFQLW